MYYCCGVTEKGIMSHNEDALLINGSVIDSGSSEQTAEVPFLAAVSDGVSGERSGELASRMCLELLRDKGFSNIANLEADLMDVHRGLAKYSESDPETHNMQATVCGVAVDADNRIYIFNVGDSRLYRFRGGRIKQISRDQSLVQLLIDEGAITTEERRTHVHRNIIFPVLGNVKSAPQIDITELTGGMEYGDLLLLCTDGLSDYVSILDIEEILEMPKSMKTRLHLLVNKALESGSKDNITVIAIVFTE
ncbi:MAG: serine/threonine-protein phosphatase [Ruminococcus sp.]|jgi:serine/threonine protein phosphatase PrpC|uniref:PP2C family protein-serine/threonine phosphatase n=1 Tax=Ruminococcus sp. TaxID=41978 RepID=UPI001B1F4458|nr:protein phosphatase 2C domain-containing protein [Ruminococcus sp.]MBO7474999.1 serine/threonine-protein phosphatase [Ruminococcus sp.]